MYYNIHTTKRKGDQIVSFHYYGARYYWSELLAGWLSVDPMADKYPSISPYAYCVWNPVKLVDPDGMDTIVSINTKKPTRTRITGRGDLGTARKLHNRYVTNRNLVTYARMYYKGASDVVHIFMHGDPAHVELADGRPLDAKALYLYIFSRSPQLQKNEIQDKASLVVLHSCSTGKGEQSIAQQLSQESSTLIVLAPSDLLLAENGKETVDNNGKWNVYKGGKLVKQYEGFGRTPEQMKELCKKIQNEFK